MPYVRCRTLTELFGLACRERLYRPLPIRGAASAPLVTRSRAIRLARQSQVDIVCRWGRNSGGVPAMAKPVAQRTPACAPGAHDHPRFAMSGCYGRREAAATGRGPIAVG